MAQISLYVPDSEMAELRSDAVKDGKSVSSYVRKVLRNRKNNRANWENGWPPGYFDLYGCDPDFPDIEDLPAKEIEAL